ncbi:hypothetical protein K443DRAFT_380667 [Laccaria amethystina LaAM-08-1]|uniref:Uncharacterized protein n=1 Tax=Laccaria amethystina LaAM-08-1 TaxID=1095629 RepID=A0A0C9XBX3_9AGAR|nr:hypothetical protein K443DRAFT_380667 [Laccaria amethystina LaAM-08-1]
MTVAFYSNIQASSPTNELHNICVCLHRVHSPSTGRTTSADFVHTHFEPFTFAFGRRLGLSGSLSSLSVVCVSDMQDSRALTWSSPSLSLSRSP